MAAFCKTCVDPGRAQEAPRQPRCAVKATPSLGAAPKRAAKTVTLTVNGREIATEEGKTILQVRFYTFRTLRHPNLEGVANSFLPAC